MAFRIPHHQLRLLMLTNQKNKLFLRYQARLLATRPAVDEKCPFQQADATEKPKIKTTTAKNTWEDDFKNAKSFESIPGPKPLPLIGVGYMFLPGGKYYNKTMLELHRKLREEYGNLVKVPGLNGRPDILLSFNPDDIEKCYRTEGQWPFRRGFQIFEYFRKEERPDMFKKSSGLISDQGEPWHNMRTKVNPVMLQPKTVKMYIPMVDDIVNDFIARIKLIRDSNNEMPKDFMNEMNKWALESIGCIALDTRLGVLGTLPKDDPAQKLIESVHDFFELSFQLEVLPSIWKYYKTPAFKKLIKALHTMTDVTMSFIDKAIERIEKNPSTQENQSVLEKLLKIDRNIAIVMALDMLMAGVDTTSVTTINLLYQLAKNPEKQEILRKEIREKLPNKDSILTTESMANMPYLRACMKESARINPITIGSVRAAGQDIVLQGYKIPKGFDVAFSHMLLSNDKEFFPRPHEYLPERWLKDQENIDIASAKDTHPFTFMPFGFGPRMCIGKRFAELEIEVLTSRIIRNFKVEWHHPDLEYASKMLNIPKGSVKFTFIDLKD